MSELVKLSRKRLAVICALLAALVILLALGYELWYFPRETRVSLEQEAHRFFWKGNLDSAVTKYEAAMQYGTLSQVADDMYRMAKSFCSDTILQEQYFELADSLGPEVRDLRGRIRTRVLDSNGAK